MAAIRFIRVAVSALGTMDDGGPLRATVQLSCLRLKFSHALCHGRKIFGEKAFLIFLRGSG